ncbi:hypothetical protein Hanom_Chr13g01224621 [Helianthus anomalus]
MGAAEARLGPAPVPHTAPWGSARHNRPLTAGVARPLSPLASHIYLYIHTYIYIKGFIPHPHRSIPTKPLLRGASSPPSPSSPYLLVLLSFEFVDREKSDGLVCCVGPWRYVIFLDEQLVVSQITCSCYIL